MEGIAIIGMSGRFPGAANVEEFWQLLRAGTDAVSFFSDDELLAAGVPPAHFNNPHYVKAKAVLQNADLFDAAFFGFNPREAEVLDPQHRLFLETAWEALESAGYAPGSTRATVGIFGGSSTNDYLSRHVLAHPEVVAAVGRHQVELGNGKDYLVAR